METKRFLSYQVVFDKKSGTYPSLMDNKRNIFIFKLKMFLKEYCYETANVIKRAKFKVILN